MKAFKDRVNRTSVISYINVSYQHHQFDYVAQYNIILYFLFGYLFQTVVHSGYLIATYTSTTCTTVIHGLCTIH